VLSTAAVAVLLAYGGGGQHNRPPSRYLTFFLLSTFSPPSPFL
jgi:hypothetical protein